jgi:hypothetical protein
MLAHEKYGGAPDRRSVTNPIVVASDDQLRRDECMPTQSFIRSSVAQRLAALFDTDVAAIVGCFNHQETFARTCETEGHCRELPQHRAPAVCGQICGQIDLKAR